MKKAELKALVGKCVKVTFKDNKEIYGVLGYTESFGVEYGYRKPNRFTISNIDFLVSHIKKCEVF